MCGIFGYISENKIRQDPSFILNAISHRGPDSQGWEQYNLGLQHVVLGHTRLSILDLSEAGSQPFTSQNGDISITYNGEIYNHLELRKSLNISFKGHSDTETLVEYISKYGIHDTLKKLNGMFAFGLLDRKNNFFYLVRDPFGIKPLYYTITNGYLSFSSEIKALQAAQLASTEIDREALDTFLTLRYNPSPKTLFKNIFRLPPGHVLSYSLEDFSFSSECYIDSPSSSFEGSLDEAEKEYHSRLKTAVNRQLLSDVPVGLFLSGGIDSAILAALVKEIGFDLPTFTVGFSENFKECEILEAERTAKFLGLKNYSIKLDENVLKNNFSDIIRAIEEPIGTTSILPMWHLVNLTRKSVTVVLTGQGSDEPWGGYQRYQIEVLKNKFPKLTKSNLLKKILGNFSDYSEISERSYRALCQENMVDSFIEAYALFSKKERELLTHRTSTKGCYEIINNWVQWFTKQVQKSSTEIMMGIDARMNLSDDLLLYGDKLSMAFSLEARVPFLDIDLINFVESLPVEFKINLNKTKILHKRLAGHFLSQEIIKRKKKGFQVPFTELSKGSWKLWIEDILLDPKAPHFDELDYHGVKKIWHLHLSSKSGRSRQIFSLLCLALWWRGKDQFYKFI